MKTMKFLIVLVAVILASSVLVYVSSGSGMTMTVEQAEFQAEAVHYAALVHRKGIVADDLTSDQILKIKMSEHKVTDTGVLSTLAGQMVAKKLIVIDVSNDIDDSLLQATFIIDGRWDMVRRKRPIQKATLLA